MLWLIVKGPFALFPKKFPCLGQRRTSFFSSRLSSQLPHTLLNTYLSSIHHGLLSRLQTPGVFKSLHHIRPQR